MWIHNMYRIAIPSYDRIDLLINKTLQFLIKHNMDFTKIDLFLGSQSQFDLYHSELSKTDLFHDINIIITDTEGIGNKRNFIRNYYRNETEENYILCLDDDITDIKNMETSLHSLTDFLSTAFKVTEQHNLNLWGVCAYHNPFFLKNNYTTNLKYICGAFYGLIIDRTKDIVLTKYNHFEDMEFSILHFKRDKGLMRFNNIGIKTKYFGKGGINNSYGGLQNRQLDMEIAGKKFVSEYHGYSKLIKKKIGYDIRLNHRAKSCTSSLI